jgi:hypothetical protein
MMLMEIVPRMNEGAPGGYLSRAKIQLHGWDACSTLYNIYSRQKPSMSFNSTLLLINAHSFCQPERIDLNVDANV